ncbi:hypothetical protein PVAP13_1NG120300 [Panicum virgatum]|uniref:Uncharacterized protein n=1 Tax=Panicum virgatum TaxID=38727 RepID=A0A8T0WV82_PANVG|nr:hypothetical protein PVAP13_1NG120300 [Panicum virgatum]
MQECNGLPTSTIVSCGENLEQNKQPCYVCASSVGDTIPDSETNQHSEVYLIFCDLLVQTVAFCMLCLGKWRCKGNPEAPLPLRRIVYSVFKICQLWFSRKRLLLFLRRYQTSFNHPWCWFY